MRHFICLFLLLIFTLKGFAQISGTVNYKNTLHTPKRLEKLKKKDPKKYQKYKFLIQKLIAIENQIAYTLEFNAKTAVFQPEEIMAKDNQRLVNTVNDKNIYFYDRNKDQRFYETEKSGKYFLVSQPALKWKILTETKMIQGYLCQKATSKQIFHSFDSDGKANDKTQPITAWFTKEIPLPYGPENYAGLPGLILKLKSQGNDYEATKIKVTDKTKTVLKPKEGEKITEKAFAKKMNTAYRGAVGF